MAKTNNYDYQSITTPSLTHKKSYQFAAEAIVYRLAIEKGYALPEFFWRKVADCEDEYKKLYGTYCEMLAKATKIAPDHFVVLVCIYSRLSHLTYGKLLGTLKYRWEKWNSKITNRFTNLVKMQQQQSAAIDSIVKDVKVSTTTGSVQQKRKRQVSW